jgi:hypothetical protein
MPSAGRRLILIEPASAVAAMAAHLDCIWPTTASSRSLTVVSDRVWLARSDVDPVFGTGAGCRRSGDQARCVLPVVR